MEGRREEELPEPSNLVDLAEHRLRDGLSLDDLEARRGERAARAVALREEDARVSPLREPWLAMLRT